MAGPMPGDALDDGRVCVVVTGAPGAGKSSVGQALARTLRHSALLDGDVVSRFVVGGYLWPLGEPASEADRQVRLCHENLCRLALTFAGHGFTPVVETVLSSRAELDRWRTLLRPLPVLLLVLAPGAEECRRRNLQRPAADQFFFDDYDGLEARMRDGFGEQGWWFDTAGLSLPETVRRVVDESLGRAALDPV